MNETVIIKQHRLKDSLLIINEELAAKLNLSRRKWGYISFGTRRNFIGISISREAGDGEILLPREVMNDLCIPEYPIFEVRVKGNEVLIGPCIGILASQKDEDITKRRLKEISMNTLDYPRIRGAIIVFSLDKADRARQTVEGYCYNPVNDSWERGIFPYPLAIYRRTSLNSEWQNHFLSAIGDAVFNNYSFDKWDMYRWFSAEPDIRGHLPFTKIFENSKDIIELVKKYNSLYVKPIWGMKGFGVVKVSLSGERLVFEYRQDDENKTISSRNPKEAEKAIETLFAPGSHIVQQGLELIKHDGGVVDFRCVMQKNETRKWVCNGIVARTGAKESVVSNISSGGMALPALDLLRDALSLTETETFLLREKMISLCMKVCNTLDEYGINFGTLGLDLGIDENRNVWLIEVNNRRPHPAIALRVNDVLSYYTILASPLHYAKSLAGFGPREEDRNVL